MGAASVVGGIGKGIQAYGDYQATKAEAKLLKQNARLAAYQAQNAIEQGEEDVRLIRQDRNMLIGAQRAAAGGSGLLVNEGSALDVQEDTAYQSEMDISRARYNALLRAYGYKIEEKSLKYQAKMKKKAATLNLLGGLMQAGGEAIPTSGGGGG